MKRPLNTYRINLSDKYQKKVEALLKELDLDNFQDLVRFFIDSENKSMIEDNRRYGTPGVKKQSVQERINEKVKALSDMSAEEFTEFLQNIQYREFTPYLLDVLEYPDEAKCDEKIHHMIVKDENGLSWKKILYNMNDPKHKPIRIEHVWTFQEIVKDLVKLKLI